MLSVGFAAEFAVQEPRDCPCTEVFGFLYRPCGAATQQRNPAPPQPPGRSMWQLPCKIPKSLQRHLVPVWENRWQHWQGLLSACFSFKIIIYLPKASWSAWAIGTPEKRLFSSGHSTISFVFLKIFLRKKCLLTKFALLVRQVPTLHCFVPFGVSYFLKAQGNGATFTFCIHFSKHFIQEGLSQFKNLCSHVTRGWQQLLLSEVLHAAFVSLEIRANSWCRKWVQESGTVFVCRDGIAQTQFCVCHCHSSVIAKLAWRAESAAGWAQGPSFSQMMVKACL